MKLITDVRFPKAISHHSGKIRESFVLDAERRAIVVTDRISAFDYILGAVPQKGAVLNQIAAWWFEKLNEIKIPHHLLSVPHPNVSVVRNVTPLPVEFVVRGYLTGTTTTSSWYAYQHHDRKMCGLELPAGMQKNEPFPKPIITPTTKPTEGHDMNVSYQEILDMGLVEKAVLDQAYDYALKMFVFGQKVAADRGLILVDTKYEMGLTPDGELLVIDEVHTPDSSRYWVQATYAERMAKGEEPEGLDKEFVRRMVVEAGYDVDGSEDPAQYFTDDVQVAAAVKYQELYRMVTGDAFSTQGDGGESEIVAVLKKMM